MKKIYDLDTSGGGTIPVADGSLRMTLVNPNNGRPLAHVPVQLCRSGVGGSCRSGRTGADGSLRFDTLALADYELSIYIPGMVEPDRRSVTVDGDTDLGTLEFPLPTGSLSGRAVRASDGAPVAGVYVTACTATSCAATTTAGDGTFAIGSLPDGTYRVHLSPPGTLRPRQAEVIVDGGDDTQIGDVALTQPTPPPTGFSVNDSPPGEIPTLIVGNPTTFELPSGCSSPTFQVLREGVVMEFIQDGATVTTGTAAQQADGTFAAEFTVPFTGPAEVVVSGGSGCEVSFSIYIDPSGHVRTTDGTPIVGATVTLLRSDTPNGTFAAVANGSTVMSSANRTNPDVTDATGHFGWDVVAGYYKVAVTAPNCTDPTDGDAVVESRVMNIPPPVTDLDLRMSCGRPGAGGGGGGGGTPAGTTVRKGSGDPDRAAPLHVAVTSPGAGEVVIEERTESPEQTPSGAVRLRRRVAITAPPTTPEIPIEIRFALHRSLLAPGTDPDAVEVERDLAIVPPCAEGASTAAPDPCVKSREIVGDDVVITVLTSRASTWSFLVPGAACAPGAAAAFSDVDSSNVHAGSIGCLAKLAVTMGLDAETFGPGRSVTRGQMASFVVRALRSLGADVPPGRNAFGDDDGSTHEDAINALAATRIVTGKTRNRYAAGDVVTREQAASLVVRSFEWLTGTDLRSTRDHFDDDDGNVHEAAINAAADRGLLVGVSADRFAPRRAVRRDQMATFLNRLLDAAVTVRLLE